jgi:ribosomal-protein-alanine N-acetyltransferase
MSNAYWPVTLTHGDVRLRPLRITDGRIWQEVRLANESWLAEWEATAPVPSQEPAPSFQQVARKMRRDARRGLCLPFVVEYKGEFVGQLNVNNIVYGALREANFGYWIDERISDRGIMTTAAALVTDYLLITMNLHRVEIAVRPENVPSNRLVQRLGFHFEGIRPRFLHINHDWRDHNIYSLLRENMSGPLVNNLPAASS